MIFKPCGKDPAWSFTNRLLLIMKLTVVLTTVLTLNAFAEIKAQNITLNVKNRTLEEVMREIQQQQGYPFFFRGDHIATIPVTADIREADLHQAMSAILSGKELAWTIKDGIIVIKHARGVTSSIPASTTMQQRIVTGNVTDDAGSPLEGVTVFIKGSGIATTSGSDGSYRISVPEGATTLVFTMVGFDPQEQRIPSSRVVNVTMQSAIRDIDEVVVIGYGTVQKSDLTGSVSTIKIEDAAERATSSLEQLLQGRVSGVQITQNSGAPGAGINFNIRGVNSFGENQPLIVIDGYPIENESAAVTNTAGADFWNASTPPNNPLANLNPADIESIEILKDASSTAIYGSRGANGVVLITTKKGQTNQESVSYNFRSDLNQLPRQIPMLPTHEFLNLANEAALNSGQDSLYNEQAIAELSANNYNWQDLIYQNSYSQDHQVVYTGGDQKNKFAVIGSYTAMDGIVLRSKFNRGGLRANFERESSERFKFGLNFNTNLSLNQSVVQSNTTGAINGSVITAALRFRPVNIPYTDEGDIDISVSDNPLATIYHVDDDTRARSTLANVYAQYRLADGLQFKINGGINDFSSLRQSYYGQGTFVGNQNNGLAYRGETNAFNYLAEYTLNYNKKIFKNHRINAVAGYTWQQWYRRSSGVRVSDFSNDNLSYHAMQYGNNIANPVTGYMRWALASYLARVNYVIANKYLLTFTGRSDGSSRLADGEKWAFFPSVALGWNAHREKFLENIDVISELKLRASYGISGNQTVRVGATQAQLTNSRVVVGNDILTGVVLSSFENPDLHWETTQQIDIGLDLGWAKNRYRLTIDAYQKQTKDLLISLSIPGNLGFTGYETNVGKIENKGLDIEASAQILTTGFHWNVSGNISFNRNKVISLGDIEQINGNNLLGNFMSQYGTIARTGLPLGTFFGYRINGIYQSVDEIAAGPTDVVNTAPGDFKYVDVNHDGQITTADRTIIGDPNPDYIFGLTNDFNYKGIGVSILVQGMIGHDVLNLNRYFSDGLVFPVAGNARQEAFDGRWTGPGTSNYYPRAKTSGTLFDNRVSDFLIEDGSFVRLKNVNVSYNFAFSGFRYLKSLKVFANATNLLTFTKYKGYDPEVSAIGNSALNRNIDFGTIPLFRTFSFGVNASF